MKDYFSKDFTSLINNLLSKNPNQRMKIKAIKSHAFFKKIDWEKMENLAYKAPI